MTRAPVYYHADRRRQHSTTMGTAAAATAAAVRAQSQLNGTMGTAAVQVQGNSTRVGQRGEMSVVPTTYGRMA